MAYLFDVKDKLVIPNTETLMIEPFKSIWERDTSKKKEKALQEFAYIEFMTSMLKSNPFRQYPEDRKHIVVKETVIVENKWSPDELVIDGMRKVVEFQKEASSTYSYYMAAKTATEKMKEFYLNFNIGERNFKSGNPIYKPRDITSALNDTEKVLANLNALEKKVEEELFEEIKTRSDKKISFFADPSSINS